jgi:hypothetical protein
MKRSLAIAVALFALTGGIAPWTGASAQWPPPGTVGGPPAGSPARPPGAPPGQSLQEICGKYQILGAEAKKKADLVQAAMNAKAERSKVCTLMTSFVAAEASIGKFLEDNKTWCGVPDEAIKMQKASHEKSVKFRNAACDPNAAGPTPKPPSLSDAMKMPSVDSATNTKTGRGTFDTLTGNPLSR